MKLRDWIIALVGVCVFIIGFILLLEGHWFWGLILGFPALLLLIIFLSELTNPSNNSNPKSNNIYYTSGYSRIWLEKRNGYTKYEMVGMYYRNLKRSDMGKFEGYAKADTNNNYDSHAVAVYNNSGKHLGFIPKGNKYLYDLILNNGASLPAYGYISCDASGNNFIGEVGIKTNTTLNTDHPFYDQSITIIGKFEITQIELAERLIQLGANISNTIHVNTNIVLMGEKVKSVKMIDKLESLLKEGYKIRVIYKEELNSILNG